jgi:hypothetical protein
MTYVDRTERIGELIVQVVADDTGATSPRDNDNITQIYGDHRSYIIGDGTPPSEHAYILERGGVRLLWRYMRRYGDPADKFSPLLAFTKLSMLDHSGISFYTTAVGESSTHWSDYGGWDSGGVGYVYVSRKAWDTMHGGDSALADEVIAAEVKEYDDWASGNVWAYRVVKPCDHADEHDSDEEIADCPHAEIVDDCYGFIGDPKYAWDEARAAAQAVTA